MKSKTTAIWFVLAVTLAAFIWLIENYLEPAAPAQTRLLPGWRVAETTGFQIFPAGATEISATRTNDFWQLLKPFAYPAQSAAIENLLGALEKIAPARLTAGELRGHPDAEYGFDNPRYSLVITAGDQHWQLQIGNRTAPGDQVFIRVVGVDGAFVADAGWLQFLPRSANDWRDTALVALTGTLDGIVITNGTKAIELRRDPTNHLWRLVRPLSARADSARIGSLLQQLGSASVTQFVTDDPRTDLSTFGLQPAELDVWLDRGTNAATAVHAGKALPENPTQNYARREGWNSVLAVAGDTFAAWRGAVNDFRDPHLLELTAPVAEIDVRGENNNNYILQAGAGNNWVVAGEKFPADLQKVQDLIQLLGNYRISGFVKDVVTGPDLQNFGLTTPAREITLRPVTGDTNAVLARLLIGATVTNQVFVKMADEDFVYSLTPGDLARLPEFSWEFRDRRIWSFNETNVTQITLRQGGRTRQLLRNGPNSWSLAAGSQGIINPPAVEETVHRLGGLAALGWIARNVTEPAKFGLSTNNLSLTVDLKSGEKLSVDFGAELPSQTALAAVTLEGERWAFVFPPVVYQFVAAYLTIPANAP